MADSKRFIVQMRGVVDIAGHDELDGRSPIYVAGEAELRGLIIVPENISPKILTAVEASRVASQLLTFRAFTNPSGIISSTF